MGAQQLWRVAAAAGCLLLAAAGNPVSAQTGETPFSRDCRYDSSPAAIVPEDHYRGVVLPDDDIFRPPLADLKEPRLSFTYRRVRFSQPALPSGGGRQTINAGVVSAGGVLGIWGRRAAGTCSGLQIGLLGGVFSQFDLDAPSSDLINSDFIAGAQITVREGRLSGRARLYHQSSHLGDEFLLRNPSVMRLEFGFEAIDALASYEGSWWRLYGGGGYIFFADDRLGPGLLQGGLEVYRRPHSHRGVAPVAGLDVIGLQARNWGQTANAIIGVQRASASGVRRVRAVLVLTDGFIPFGQFTIEQKLRSAGVQLQIEF